MATPPPMTTCSQGHMQELDRQYAGLDGPYGALVTDEHGREYVMMGVYGPSEAMLRAAWAYFRAHPEEVYAGYAYFLPRDASPGVSFYFRPVPRRDHLATIARILHDKDEEES